MGRRKLHDAPVTKRVCLRESQVNKIDILLFDPLTNKPRYGGWAKVLSQALDLWLEKYVYTKGEKFDPTEPPVGQWLKVDEYPIPWAVNYLIIVKFSSGAMDLISPYLHEEDELDEVITWYRLPEVANA